MLVEFGRSKREPATVNVKYRAILLDRAHAHPQCRHGMPVTRQDDLLGFGVSHPLERGAPKSAHMCADESNITAVL